jgi:hypothetical protein
VASLLALAEGTDNIRKCRKRLVNVDRLLEAVLVAAGAGGVEAL